MFECPILCRTPFFVGTCAQALQQPANKLQLSRDGVGFLRDQHSLAFFNVAGEVQLQLSIRERGGRKK